MSPDIDKVPGVGEEDVGQSKRVKVTPEENHLGSENIFMQEYVKAIIINILKN